MNNRNCINKPCTDPPTATAVIKGSEKYPSLCGTVRFFCVRGGILIKTDVSGLPKSTDGCGKPVFAFHIHDGESCSGNETDPFANAKGHYNPKNYPHPYHAGDMPPLFGVKGKAFSCFLTDRFTVREIIGKTVIIHRMPDDFMTQPSGNAGEKIACGVIMPARNRQQENTERAGDFK